MNIRRQVLFWLCAALTVLLFVWTFKVILLPFVVGIAIAYLLNPALVKLTHDKISRTILAIAILSSFFLLVIILALLLVPPFYTELTQLAEQAPVYIETVWGQMQPYVEIVEETVNEEDLDESIQAALKDNIGEAISVSSNLLGGLLNGGKALVSLATFIVVTPLVAFFMMVEWQQMVSWVDELLPRHSYSQVKELLAQVDQKIAGFIRGQLLVAASLGLFYSLALSIAGLQFGFLIGMAAGALSVIPLFGSIVGLFIGVGVAWLQSSQLSYLLIIAGIFMFGQFLEGNFITPKLVGQSVGLHPLWILFALMAGGALFGIVGMIIAVPVAATTGVFISFTLQNYKESAYYK